MNEIPVKFDLTVIICATNLAEAYSVCQNIRQTSGLKCQFLIYDNQKDKFPIAKVYNMYASIAQADSILLVHQDVEFLGTGWGRKILKKLKEDKTGAIGFAGSMFRPKEFYGAWPITRSLARNNYCQQTKDWIIYDSVTPPFDEVVILDGLSIFCTREVLLSFPFDEKNLTGFHCYDIDFTLTLFSNGYHNYVFTDKDCPIFHKSAGKYGKDWIEQTFKMTQIWDEKFLPACVQGIDIGDYQPVVEWLNQKYIYMIKKFLDHSTAKKMISMLPFKDKTEQASNQLAQSWMHNNGYRSWN